MPESLSFARLILLLPGAIVAAYAVVWLLVGARPKRPVRSALGGVVATVFVFAYLIIRGEGPGRFPLTPTLSLLVLGVAGCWLLDWIRARLVMRPR